MCIMFGFDCDLLFFYLPVPFLAASRGLSLELVVIITCVAVVTLVVVVSMLFVLRTCMVKWRKNVDQSQHNLSDRQSQQPLTGAGPYFDSLKLIDIIGDFCKRLFLLVLVS